MGRLYIASVLIAISGKGQSAKPVEVELEPIVPGAWAAWAKSAPPEAAAPAPKLRKATTMQPAGNKA